MSIKSDVRRPRMYAIVGLIGMALALPLAIASGQTKIGGLFDECYEANCSTDARMAELD